MCVCVCAPACHVMCGCAGRTVTGARCPTPWWGKSLFWGGCGCSAAGAGQLREESWVCTMCTGSSFQTWVGLSAATCGLWAQCSAGCIYALQARPWLGSVGSCVPQQREAQEGCPDALEARGCKAQHGGAQRVQGSRGGSDHLQPPPIRGHSSGSHAVLGWGGRKRVQLWSLVAGHRVCHVPGFQGCPLSGRLGT